MYVKTNNIKKGSKTMSPQHLKSVTKFYRPSSKKNSEIVHVLKHTKHIIVFSRTVRQFNIIFNSSDCEFIQSVSQNFLFPSDLQYYSNYGIFFHINLEDCDPRNRSITAIVLPMETSDNDMKQNYQLQLQIINDFIVNKVKEIANLFGKSVEFSASLFINKFTDNSEFVNIEYPLDLTMSTLNKYNIGLNISKQYTGSRLLRIYSYSTGYEFGYFNNNETNSCSSFRPLSIIIVSYF